MNLDNLVAIDVHTHAEVSLRDPPDELAKEFEEAAEHHFRQKKPRPTIPEAAEYYR